VKKLCDIEVCGDCLGWIANGTIPDDRPTLLAEIAKVWPGDMRHIVAGNSEDDNDEGAFSWSGCECCGSRLGGTRYAAAVLTADLSA